MNKDGISDEKALKALKDSKGKAEEIISDEDKFERFCQRLEKKMKVVPLVGDKLSYIPIMASLINSYRKKEYTDIPVGTVISIVGALIYFVSPVDLIPDGVPVVGYLDDAVVIKTAWDLTESDIKEYQDWREKTGKTIIE